MKSIICGSSELLKNLTSVEGIVISDFIFLVCAMAVISLGVFFGVGIIISYRKGLSDGIKIVEKKPIIEPPSAIKNVGRGTEKKSATEEYLSFINNYEVKE